MSVKIFVLHFHGICSNDAQALSSNSDTTLRNHLILFKMMIKDGAKYLATVAVGVSGISLM